MNFAVPADHEVKLIENEKKDKYMDLARELKRLWNMKVIIIPIGIGAFGTVNQGLLKGLEDLKIRGRMETIRTTLLSGTARILRSLGDLRRLAVTKKFSERPSANADVKNPQGVNNNNNNNNNNNQTPRPSDSQQKRSN